MNNESPPPQKKSLKIIVDGVEQICKLEGGGVYLQSPASQDGCLK